MNDILKPWELAAQGAKYFAGVNAETVLVTIAVIWCGSHSSQWHLASLLLCSLTHSILFPLPSEFCRKHASTGLVLGTLVLPALFAVQADTVDALSIVFRLTWWAGLVANMWRALTSWVNPTQIILVAVIDALCIASSIETLGDATLLPALLVFLICLTTIQTSLRWSFTSGEAIVIAELCAVLFHVILFSILLDRVPLLVLTSKLHKIIAIGLFAAISISSSNLLLCRFRACGAQNGPTLYQSVCHIVMTLLLLALTLWWMTLSIGENAVQWVWTYVTNHTETPLKFIVYYIAVLVPALILAPDSKVGSHTQVITRKYFHLLALVMFVPTIMINIRFMSLAFAVALAVFVVVEALRISRMPVLQPLLDSFMQAYIDDRDSGDAVLTHIYLLLGCALPVFYTFFVLRGIFSAKGLLIALSGVTVTGLGDAMASLIGVHFGKHRWHGCKKTMEGTAAMIVGILAFQIACLYAVGFHNLSNISWCRLVIADILVATLEAKTDQIDNIFLPLYHVALLQMV